MADLTMSAPTVRRFAAVNWRGVATLYWRETARFFRYAGETLAGPAVSALLFLAVFHLALGDQATEAGVSVAAYIGPGIVLFMTAHGAFEGGAIPILYQKLEGILSDVIAAPLTPLELLAGYVLPAVGNALTVGAMVLLLVAIFVDIPLHAPFAVAGFAIAAAVLLALLGLIVGIWAERWDGYSAAETFLVAPLGFLSGAFFPLDGFPADLRWIFHLNPLFHAVEGFRYGFIGQAQSPLLLAGLVLVGLILVLALLAWRLLATGYRIKP